MHKYHEERFLDRLETSPEKSLTDTQERFRSCRSFKGLRGAVAADTWLFLEWGRCKDAVDYTFFCGGTLPCRKKKKLLIGSSGKKMDKMTASLLFAIFVVT